MDGEEVDPFVITVDGERVEGEVKEIFEVGSDGSFNLPTPETKKNKLTLHYLSFEELRTSKYDDSRATLSL
jgi:hypothetical protein